MSWDGAVAPCVCTNMPIRQGLIPRIFCWKQYKIPRLSFGIVAKEGFFDIWNKREYREFRQYFHSRKELHDSTLLEVMPFEGGVDLRELEGKREELMEKLKNLPLPTVCETCYKAYNV